jgi:hypothetical protein
VLALLLVGCSPEASLGPAATAAPGGPAAPAWSAPGDSLLAPGQLAAMVRGMGLSGPEELTHYTLDISLSDVAGEYQGEGTVAWTNLTGAPVSALPLLLHPNAPAELGAPGAGSLALHEATVRGRAVTVERPRPTLARVVMEPPVAPGERIEVGLRFGGRLKLLDAQANDLFAQAFGGMGQLGSPVGASDYGLLGQGDGIVTAASAYPMIAPFDGDSPLEPRPTGVGDLAWNEAAIFELRVLTPEGLRVVSNLLDAEPEALGSGTWLTRSAGAGVRDLVLVASRDWAVESAQVGGVTVRSWALSQDAAAGAKALEEACATLATLSRLYTPYPFTELEVVEASLIGGAGGVEFSGLTLIAGFLYRDPRRSRSPMAGLMSLLGGIGGGGGGLPPEIAELTASQRRFVVAHEVAHQWSPGLVGADAHRSPVVDEPMAQYLAGRAVQELLGDEAGAAERDRNVLINFALYRLMGGEDRATDRPTASFGSSLEYAALVYGKAPYLYVDLEERLGRARLDAAIRGAMQASAWEVVDGEGWLAALESAGASGARERGRRWWQEAHGDEDLALDPEGRAALRLLFGEEMAAQVEASFAALGMPPAALFQMMGGGLPTTRPYAPGALSPAEMLELLDEP